MIDGITIGQLISEVINVQMHHFCFFAYNNGKWKGCRDFMCVTSFQPLREYDHLKWLSFISSLQYWGNLARKDIIAQVSEEEPSVLFAETLTYTYQSPQRKAPGLINRGYFNSFTRIHDDLTPESVLSEDLRDFVNYFGGEQETLEFMDVDESED
jgi:hypothetical protein